MVGRNKTCRDISGEKYYEMNTFGLLDGTVPCGGTVHKENQQHIPNLGGGILMALWVRSTSLEEAWSTFDDGRR